MVPAFWQTFWFKGLSVVFLLFIAVAVHLIRVRNIKKRERLLEMVVSERTFELEQKKEELQNLNEELEVKVDERTQDLLENKEILRLSEEKYRSLIQDSGDAIYLLYENRFELINNKFQELFGYTFEEVNSKKFNFKKLVAPESIPLIEERSRLLEEGKEVLNKYEFTAVSKSGKEIEVEVSVSYIKYKEGIATQGILRDITQRKTIEKINTVFKDISEASLISESLEDLLPSIHKSLSTIIDTTNFYLALYDINTNKISFPYFKDEKVLNLPEIDGNHPDSLTVRVIKTKKPLLYKPHKQRIERILSTLIAPEAEVWLGVPLLVEDEAIGAIAVQSYTNPDIYAEKDIKLIEAVSNHIANAIARKRALNALIESEEKYKNLIKHSNDAIYLQYNNKFEIVNDKFEEMFGFSQEEVNKSDFDFMDLVAPKSKSFIIERMEKIKKGKELSPSYEFTAISKSGKEINVEASVTYLKYKDGIANQGILRDITDRIKTQEAMKIADRASRLASLGTLTAGIAHEINQPLTALKVLVDSLLYYGKQDKEMMYKNLKENLTFISDEAEKISEIILHMRSLVKQDNVTEFELVDINKVIKKAFKLINEQLQSHGINVKLELQKDLPKIYAHSTPVEQIISNLVINAMHSLDTAEKEDKIIMISTIKKDENCILEVTDNGPGIPEENLNSIFDPFFTTKVNEEGMGLGLTIIQNFVNSFGGTISAKNLSQGGAVFTVSLPAASSKLRNNK